MSQAVTLEPVGHGAYRHAVNRQLLSRMLRGYFASGERLTLSNLAKQLDISITPVREAMLDLAALGMVEFHTNRGAVARSFGPTELAEIYQLRRIMEVEAVMGACGRIPEGRLQQLNLQLVEAQKMEGSTSSPVAIQTDIFLHKLIAEHCGSRRLREEIQRYDVLMQAVRDVLGNRNHIQKHAVREHQQIVKALLKPDAQRAADLLAKHIDRTARDVAAILWPVKEQP